MSYTYNSSKKRFYIELDAAISESDATPWVRFVRNTTTGVYEYEFLGNLSTLNSRDDAAKHTLDNGIMIPKTHILADPSHVIVFGNINSGEVYVHDTNEILDLHTLMDTLKITNGLYSDNRTYKFGGIDYFEYDENTNKYSVPEEEFTLSLMALKKSSIVTKDRKIVLNDKVNELTFAQTNGNEKGIYYWVDSGTLKLPEIELRTKVTFRTTDAFTNVDYDYYDGDFPNGSLMTQLENAFGNTLPRQTLIGSINGRQFYAKLATSDTYDMTKKYTYIIDSDNNINPVDASGISLQVNLGVSGIQEIDLKFEALTESLDSLRSVPVTEYEPSDKVIYNRLRLLNDNNEFKKTVYVPNISVKCEPSKWIYIRNRSNGTFHNTYLSEIDNLHLYLTSVYSHPTSGTGIAEINYLSMVDKHTKAANDWSERFNFIYTVSAEEQAPLNDTARQIVLEEDGVAIPFSESNGLNDGTGYRFMDGDNNDLSFKKLESRNIKVDGKKFYYPIVSVRAPVNKAIRIVGAPKGAASNKIEYLKDTATGFETTSSDNKIKMKLTAGLEYFKTGTSVIFEDSSGNRTDFITVTNINTSTLEITFNQNITANIPSDITDIVKLDVFVSNTEYFWETKTGFIDDIVSYILNGDSSRPAGFRGLGFASVEGNTQHILLSDHLGNTTQFSVEISNLVDPSEENQSFLNIYDPLFFEPNLYSPNLDIGSRLNQLDHELPFISRIPSTANDSNIIERATFLMREDYLNDEGNLISGNLTKEAFTTLLVKLLLQEVPDTLKQDKYLEIFGMNAVGANFIRPKNLMIIKEEFKGRIERRLKRITDENGDITEEPEDATLQTNLHLNSILHLIYDYTGSDGSLKIRRQIVIEIREDRDDLVFSFDPTGHMDQTINISETGSYFNNRDHHLVKIRNTFLENSSSSNITIPLNKQFIPDPTGNNQRTYYIPVVRLNYNVQRQLQEEFYSSNDSRDLPDGFPESFVKDGEYEGTDADGNPLKQFERFKSYLENTTNGAEIHYLIDRDILMSYDTQTNNDAPYSTSTDTLKENENLEFGRNYIIMDMRDTIDGNTDYNSRWDFSERTPYFNKGYMKLEFVPILNEVIKVYYQPGKRILKKNIADKVYYRDALTGYISLLHGDQYLNKSLQYFIEKDIRFRIPTIEQVYQKDDDDNFVLDDNGNKIVIDRIVSDRIENRRYRLYLEFVPALPEYNYNKDPRIYDNNMFVTNFGLSELHNNKLFLKFSADDTKDDMYKIYFSDNALMKAISADGKVTVTYQTMIDEIMYHMKKYFGIAKDKDPYDSEVHLGSLVMEEKMVDEPQLADGSYRFKRISVRPEFAQLQKIIISKDGSTSGADAVVVNLTVYMNKHEARPGLLLQNTVNAHYSTQGYRIKVLQEEREGLKLYNLNHLDERTFLSFNSVYSLHIGLNDSKRIVVRERIVRDIVEFNNDPNGNERNNDQSITVSKYNDFLRVPLLRKMDVIKEIGGDVTTIDPADNLTVEAYFESNSSTSNFINNNLLTRQFFLDKLGLINFEFVYILNNRKFAFDIGNYDLEDGDIDVGIGFFKLVFTTLINKILAVHFEDESDYVLSLTKLSINSRVYYKDSILNDYVSLINEDFGNFNRELEYFVESTIDNVTYRLRLDFRPMPQLYNDRDKKFNLGYMADLGTTLHLAWDTNVTLMFSADDTTDDMHQVNINKSLLLNNVSNTGNILLSYTTIRNIMETEMRNLYGKSWYDREMYLFGIICNGQYIMGDGRTNGIKIIISPFEYNINKVLEIDLDIGTVTFTDQLPEEKWDYSVKSYGEFIAGIYEPTNAGNGETKVKIFQNAFASAAVLFDERNPDYNVKEVYLDTAGNHYAMVALGNVDPTSLQNLVNGVYLPNYNGLVETETTPINPTYIFNPIQVTRAAGSTTVNTQFYKRIAKGFNREHRMVDFYSRDFVGFTQDDGTEYNPNNFGLLASKDHLKSAYLKPIVHKMLSASLFTRFDNTVFISYKDEQGLDAVITGDQKSGTYDFIDNTDTANHYLLESPPESYKKRDLIMAKIKSELETKADGEKLYQSNLFKLYNALGKYETDLEEHLQRIPTLAKGDYLPYQLYDLEDFAINILVKFKGTVSGSTGTSSPEASRSQIEDGSGGADQDPGINSGFSSSKDALQNIVNEFFPQSNVYVDDKEENITGNYPAFSQPAQARIRYETMVKFQFINKQVSEDITLMKIFDDTITGSLDETIRTENNTDSSISSSSKNLSNYEIESTFNKASVRNGLTNISPHLTGTPAIYSDTTTGVVTILYPNAIYNLLTDANKTDIKKHVKDALVQEYPNIDRATLSVVIKDGSVEIEVKQHDTAAQATLEETTGN